VNDVKVRGKSIHPPGKCAFCEVKILLKAGFSIWFAEKADLL
jgi:hypothetical protein